MLHWEEITTRKPNIYMVRPAPIPDRWVCYLDPQAMMLTSSEIVVVSRDTGDVLYAGSANDEG